MYFQYGITESRSRWKKSKRKSKPTALHLLYMRIKILKFTANASRFCSARESYEAVSSWISVKARKGKVHCNSRLKVFVQPIIKSGRF